MAHPGPWHGTPTDNHADLIEKFAKAGKHVFCEKPVDLDIGRAQEVVDIAKSADVKLMLGFNRRYDPNFAATHAAQGKIGDVEMMTVTSCDPGAPDIGYASRSGGIFRDMTIHDLDMARFMLGEDPVAVWAHASVLVNPELGGIGDYGSVNVLLETASHTQAVITNSRRATYGYDQPVEIYGSLGVIDVANHHENTVRTGLADGYRTAPLMNFFITRYLASYAGEIAEFIACIEEGREPATTGEDRVIALRIANACVAWADLACRPLTFSAVAKLLGGRAVRLPPINPNPLRRQASRSPLWPRRAMSPTGQTVAH